MGLDARLPDATELTAPILEALEALETAFDGRARAIAFAAEQGYLLDEAKRTVAVADEIARTVRIVAGTLRPGSSQAAVAAETLVRPICDVSKLETALYERES